MRMKIAVAAVSALLAASVFAVDQSTVEKSYQLKDGSTVYVFKDGKMAMENKFGRVARMEEGHVMETKDGQKIMMKGDEIWRLERALHPNRGGR
ncbi:periplasmic Cu(I)/Cu(II)-binding protein CopK [Aromatoleum evansii]|uniref:periplasmic Cu(I)/Cu(II)-binding protein CopK n=1 Tax=Aromatoleum evansii TaxID=59406 RepID=UPI00145D5326|nr:periplasmic Cu(I)/Cu(II)-binding protein CopK [Aromatoleum evansii]NMG29959.1 periplasmic Cu(I)/Cu(II)-binding protein CopK [Aromatoleum evansii]